MTQCSLCPDWHIAPNRTATKERQMSNEWNRIASQAIDCASALGVHIAGCGVESDALNLQGKQELGGETGEQNTALSGSNDTEGHGSASEDAAFTQRKRRVQSPGGPPPPILSPLATAKFWGRVAVSSDFQCWEWRGAKNHSGYGRITGAMAHRVAYELINGPIPDDEIIRHRCDNPQCCNPGHMLLGSNLDNMADAVRRRRTARGTSHGNTRLREADAAYIRRNPDKLSLRKLSERERERCAKIADAEAAGAYRNPRATSYRSDCEQIARCTAERIATAIRAGSLPLYPTARAVWNRRTTTGE